MKDKYYIIDKEGDEDFIEFDTATQLEEHILALAKQGNCGIQDLKRDLTIIRGEKIDFRGTTVVNSIEILE